jgi:hypothetical protein
VPNEGVVVLDVSRLSAALDAANPAKRTLAALQATLPVDKPSDRPPPKGVPRLQSSGEAGEARQRVERVTRLADEAVQERWALLRAFLATETFARLLESLAILAVRPAPSRSK